jgi:glycosyltransferase involved in cell wall biosynthesis
VRIAVFDYKITAMNPVGSCHRRMIEELCDRHDITVFALVFDNPRPDRVRFVRVAVPSRPLALLFVLYHLMAPLCYLAYRLRGGRRFDAIQMVECNLMFGDVSYCHFCHRAYLRKRWKGSGARGVRGALRWLDHTLHGLIESWVLGRAGRIVVPSRGLAAELREEYPSVADRIQTLANPIDLGGLERSGAFDVVDFRRQQGVGDADRVLLFVALGHFERKGLPLLLEAMQRMNDQRLRLWVVGGENDLVRSYRQRTARLGLGEQVRYFGMQSDVRAYFWGADGFVLPSRYETFSLVAFQAAAAGLPVIVTPLHGVEEFVQDGHNGFVVEPAVASLQGGLARFMAAPSSQLQEMGTRAQASVQNYGVRNFGAQWSRFYAA